MGTEFTLNTINFGDGFTWEHAQKIIDREFGYRLPTIGESIIMCFDQDAIWISEQINNKQLVMDNDFGVQVVKDGSDAAVGLILVEK